MFASTNHPNFNPTKKLNINATSSSNSQVATCKLFVGNLATHTTSAHLQSIFHSYGQVIECVKVRERYGFVRFATGEEAQRALNACNGIQLNGYPMIVEYAQNEILISPLSTRTNNPTAPAPFRPHLYNTGRATSAHQTDVKLTTPITVNTTSYQPKSHSTRDDIPLLTTDTTKYAASTLNPDASTFTLSFSPANRYQQIPIDHKNSNTEHACSTSDYHSQSGLPSSGSSSVRSTGSLSPSILSAISPSILRPCDSPHEEHDNHQRRIPKEKRPSTTSTLNLHVGDRILNLYGSSTQVETSNKENCASSTPFDCRDIDPRDPVFIWNFAFYPDISMSPFVKRGDIKTLLERRVSLYSR